MVLRLFPNIALKMNFVPRYACSKISFNVYVDANLPKPAFNAIKMFAFLGDLNLIFYSFLR
jgi:hypothetical protein